MPRHSEEVIRIEGIDRVPSTPLPRAPGVARPTATAEQLIERKARRSAAARGLNEAVTWSFISEAEAERFGGSAWTLANPISEEMKAMRPSLLPGLLAATARNLARGAGDVRLFEVGRRYLGHGEHATVGLVLAGTPGRHWRSGKAAVYDDYAQGEALAILAAAARGRAVCRCSRPPRRTIIRPVGALCSARRAFSPSSERSIADRALVRHRTARCRGGIFLDAVPPSASRWHRRSVYARDAGAAGGDPRLRLRRSG